MAPTMPIPDNDVDDDGLTSPSPDPTQRPPFGRTKPSRIKGKTIRQDLAADGRRKGMKPTKRGRARKPGR